jgi:hypothetical protein
VEGPVGRIGASSVGGTAAGDGLVLGGFLMRTSLWLIQPLHLQPHFLTFHNSKVLSQELVHAN